jgi:hypothetical protein
MQFQAEVITTKDQIRWDKDIAVEKGLWKYSYIVTYKNDNPFVINGVERISHNEQEVFAHTFGISCTPES